MILYCMCVDPDLDVLREEVLVFVSGWRGWERSLTLQPQLERERETWASSSSSSSSWSGDLCVSDITSVPCRRVACVARLLIRSRYSSAALLLYLMLAALELQPCWLKKAFCGNTGVTVTTVTSLTHIITIIIIITHSPRWRCRPPACSAAGTTTS